MGKITTKKRILFSFRGQVTINGQIMSEKPGIFCAQNGQKLWVFGQPEGGEVQLGECWTLNTGAFPSVENESILSEILEQTVPDKYFLSAKACWGILRRAQEKEKEIPTVLKIALLERIAEEWSRTHTDK